MTSLEEWFEKINTAILASRRVRDSKGEKNGFVHIIKVHGNLHMENKDTQVRWYVLNEIIDHSHTYGQSSGEVGGAELFTELRIKI